ncbi:MAG: segregation ATPase FtsK/SpoIIIE, family [Solirubrobacteraceae bacterium]|jgi:S-DNA-T family DNA segregation ATPase FtsK/SpoIIIE|nr:segregation ATPase FtsK/SpoIIIE, family [Solirubrobacteraceae bacterium]
MPSLPKIKLEQHQMDLIGLGLVALAAFLSFVFYLGWDGGKVGEGLASAFVFLFGGVGYLVPVVLFGTGAVLVLKPLLPSVRPFRSGTVCLMLALMLGLAAGSFGLGPDHPARDGFFHAEYFREHGGAVGDILFFVTKTLFSSFGSHIIFVFLMLAGVLLLTGGSIAGVLNATRAGVATTTQRIRSATGEFPRVSRGKVEPRRWDEPLDPEEYDVPADVEPVVRATHVEAPARDNGDEDPAEPPAVHAESAESELSEEVFEPPPLPSDDPLDAVAAETEQKELELTPMGNYRSDVLEADDFVYALPRPGLLKRSGAAARPDTREQERTAHLLVEALGHFGVDASVVGTVAGPHVTRYELRLAPGIKMSKVSQLKDDLAYALAATDVRILAPIPGKTAVGVEVPNANRRIVHLGDVYQEAPEGWSPLTVWLGKDIAGKAIGTDLAKQPHVLVAGTTGSGKSGCVNAMLSSILLRATPNEVKLVLVDPKQVELNHYESIPHLITPVVTSPRLAANVLANLIKEMEERYGLMSRARTRNIVELNRQREAAGDKKLPYILCVIDELADLMMVAPGEVEDSIIRLAQKSRAVGIHLLLATQRPSADIITGMIKANVPARIAFAVSSQTDSRVILDQNGAESLLGQGDMLFRPASESRPARIQGAYIDEAEIEKITDHWKRQGEPDIQEELLEAVEPPPDAEGHDEFNPDADDLLGEAIATVVQMGTASTSMLQRRLRVGYTRAGRLIDMMERRGVISGYEGSKARQVLITEGDLPRTLAALDEPVGAASEPA